MAEGFSRPTRLSFEGNVAENWRRIKQNYEIYIVAAGHSRKSKKEKSCILLNLAGKDVVERYNSFTYNEEEDKDDPEILVKKFEEIYLKNIARKCDFGDLESELIKDRIVCGINSDALRKILLRETSLTLDKALNICCANELSEQQVKDLTNYQDVGELKARKNSKTSRGSYTNLSQTKEDKHLGQRFVLKNNCRNCGGKHLPKQCPAFGNFGHKCHNKNHFARVCIMSTQKSQRTVHEVSGEKLFIGAVNAITTTQQRISCKVDYRMNIGAVEKSNDEWYSELKFGRHLVNVKVDTGAKCNVISKKLFDKVTEAEQQVTKTNTKLMSTQDVKPILGLPDCERLGMVKIIIDVKPIFTCDDIFNECADLFDGKLGCLPIKHHICVNPNVKPTIHIPRRVPVAMRTKIKEELERMQQMGVIDPVEKPTEWVSSMVTVEKPNKLRICIDPRHLNEAIQREHYPLLTIEEVVSRLPGAKTFSAFDAASGFWQIPLDEDSSYHTTFNTPFVRYKFNRLPFGISPAPEVFQKAMHQLFDRIDGCEIIMDDILIWGTTEKSMMKELSMC
ncbi:uncharacterized protein LOC124457081 [Xenia sp. Carnegie-2017]|uniref:uncharacterized protein LOC124457081 n=1 Tax=Xenia sp. Carnegie-2017 TaxID=2897299 RepID=UPI001F0335B3|nr:uncharacterized protein LOC124457081 [Xenia sp. Carnegie-2017]